MVPFISLQDLADALGLDDLTGNNVATIALDSACQAVRDALDNQINLIDDDEVSLDGNGRNRLILPNAPVRSVTEVVIVGAADDGTDLTLATTDYAVDRRRFLRYTAEEGSYSWVTGPWPFLGWPLGRGNIQVTYSHGWDVTEAGGSPPEGYERVPSSIRRVALSVAQRMYSAMGTIAPTGGIASVTIGRFSESYDTSGGAAATSPDLLESELATLMPYRSLITA